MGCSLPNILRDIYSLLKRYVIYSSMVISIVFSGHICSALLGCSNIFCLQSPQHCGNSLHRIHAESSYVFYTIFCRSKSFKYALYDMVA